MNPSTLKNKGYTWHFYNGRQLSGLPVCFLLNDIITTFDTKSTLKGKNLLQSIIFFSFSVDRYAQGRQEIIFDIFESSSIILTINCLWTEQYLKYNDRVDERKWILKSDNHSNSFPATDRQWLYQTCTEFGWCQSSDSYKQPFGDWFSFPWK